MVKLLENYPFKDIGVTIAEGFSVYDGALRGAIGKEHGGIDYAWRKGDECASFEVYSMFEGDFRFGVSQALGKYLIVSKLVGECRYDCLYAHLDHVDGDLQKYAIIQGDKDFVVPAKYFLGWSGTTSKSSIRHLHIELHEINLRTRQRRRLDPYGIYDRASSGRYPRPGSPLTGFNHCWISDTPSFI